MFTRETLINELKNKTKTQIANENGITRKKLYNIEKELGIKKDDYQPLYMNKEKLLELLDEYKTPAGVAKAVGINRTTVTEWYKRHGFDNEFRRKLKLNESYFSDIDTEHKAYWLGYLMADGSMDKNCTKVTLNLSSVDEDMLKILLKDVDSSSTIKHSKDAKGHQYSRVLLNSQKMCKDLIYHGVTPKKSGKEILPSTVPDNLIRHFIRGYMDGDGSVVAYDERYKSAIRLDFASMSYNIFHSIHDFLVNAGIIEHEIIIKAEKNSKCMHLNYHSNNAIKVLEFLYKDNTICLERKHKRFLSKTSPLQ